MSLPKQIHTVTHIPSHSSSPSKSSLRSQKSGLQPRSALPSPHFEDNLLPLPSIDSPRLGQPAEGCEQVGRLLPEQHEEEAESVHKFKPLFTLLHDTQTSEHHHPTVHYIFADDDTDLIPQAALRSLGAEDAAELYEPEPETGDTHTRLPPPSTTGVKEHYILIDLAPTGTLEPSAIDPGTAVEDPRPTHSVTDPQSGSIFPYYVHSASSLSPSFALVSADIAPAPTFESPVAAKRRSASFISPDAGNQAHGLGIYTGAPPSIPVTKGGTGVVDEGPFMLKVEGISAFDEDEAPFDLDDVLGKEKGKLREGPEQGHAEESLDELVATFEERLMEIKRIVDAAAALGLSPQHGNIEEETREPSEQDVGES